LPTNQWPTQGRRPLHLTAADGSLDYIEAQRVRHWFSVMGTAKFRGFVGKLG
jgi:hypothetical protein